MRNIYAIDMDQINSPQALSDAIGLAIMSYGLQTLLNSEDSFEFWFYNKGFGGENNKLRIGPPPVEETT